MMRKPLFFVVFSLFFAVSVIAQIPKSVGVSLTNYSGTSIRMACDNKAGTVTTSLNSTAQSNDKVYLCYGDTLHIKHNGDTSFISDPNPATKSGIVYPYFDCLPAINGATMLSVLKNEPCINKQTIIVGGMPRDPDPRTGFWVLGDAAVPNRLDGLTFNDGLAQNAFNNGSPIRFYFIPTTIDSIVPNSAALAVWEGSPTGDCIHLNTSAAFQVVYLNEIKAVNIGTPGTFTLRGGLPEYDNNASSYTITIEKSNNPAIKGNITSGNVGHNGVVTYTVPESGAYTIKVSDGKSCDAIFSQIFPAVPLVFNIGTVTGKPGQTVCVDITVEDFINLASAQGTISFDTSVVKFSSIQVGAIPGVVANGTFGTSTGLLNDGKITMSWAAPSNFLPNGVTVPDGTLFAQICFKINDWANNGDTTPVRLDGSRTPLEAENKDGIMLFTPNGGAVKVNSGPTFTLDLQATATKCKNSTDGSIRVSASGGTPPYLVKWQLIPGGPVNNANSISSNGGAITIPNLAAGTYSITVTAANGDFEIGTATVDPASSLGANLVFLSKPTCAGKADGRIQVEVTLNNQTINNPSAPTYTFAWNNGGLSNIISNVKAGFYDVLVFRNNGACTDTAKASGTLTEPPPLKLTINKNDVSCITGFGTASVAVSGGTANYSYSWTNGSTSPTNANLNAGFAKVTVTDANKCTDTISTTILPPNRPKIDSIVSVNVKCKGGSTGTSTVFAKPGGSPINLISWSNSSSGNTATGLAAGIYTVTVTGTDGCTAIAKDTINEPPALIIDSISLVRPRCSEAPLNKGSITVFASGGTGTYNYLFRDATGNNTPTTNPLLAGTSPGIYSVTVTDANGCTIDRKNFELLKAPEFYNIFPSIDLLPVKCNGGTPCDGQALAKPFGGNNPTYKFVWSTGEVTNNAAQSKSTKLCQGLQFVTITDGFCTIVDTVEIKAPDVITLDTAKVQLTNVSCFGLRDGVAKVEAKGGVGPYSYNWPLFGTQGNTVDKLAAGSYTVIITDANGCKQNQSVSITQPPRLVASIDLTNTSNIKCNGDNTGTITVECANCQGAANYLWPNNVALPTSNTATGLAPGNYIITITDSKGCSDTARFILTVPPPIIAAIPYPEPPQCFGYPTSVKVDTVYGGNGGPYKISVDDGPSRPVSEAYEIYAGTHIVKIIDTSGCVKIDTLNILDPPKILVNLGPDTVIALGRTIQLTPQIISVVAPIDSLVWTPIETLQPNKRDGWLAPDATPTETTVYTLTVMDSLGCVGTGKIKVDVDRERNVYIPNVFHPEGFGDNAYFKVFTGFGVEKINYTRIFDRWGELVYSDDSGEPKWDGTFKGKRLDPGVFVYLVEVKFIDNVVIKYRGDITLLRK